MGKTLKLHAEYSLLAMLVMLPLLYPGYIFALDMVFGPHLRTPIGVGNLYLFSMVLHVLNYVVPSQVIEKLILFGILVLSGVGAHKLALRLRGSQPAYGGYFAGILYMINPFTYSRFMDGQYLVVAGYALVPYFVLELWRLLEAPMLKTAIWVALWAIGISILSLHSIFFLVLITFISLVAFSRRYRKHWKTVMAYGLAGLLLTVLASSYWLVPLLRGSTSESKLISGFNQKFAVGFQTATDPHFGVVFNAASLYGFWGDREQRYVLPKSVMPAWPVLSVIIITFAGLGAVVGWRSGRRAEIVCLATVGAVALILGMGIAFKPLAPLYYWMVQHLPLYKGYREPQKFIGLLVLTYAVLGSLGVSWLLNTLHRKVTPKGSVLALIGAVLPALMLAIPILYTPTMVWGFGGQLRPTDYPRDWYALNLQLDQDRQDFKVLFFPWHQYLSFSFTNKVIANPANIFFDKPVVQGDNIEFGGIFRQESAPETIYVERAILRPHFEITDVGSRLKTLKVKYIVVAKTPDLHLYSFLDNQTDLERVSDTQNLIVYRNKAFSPGGSK